MNTVTLIGSCGALLTTLAFLPQAVKTIRSKHTKDLSLALLVIQSMGNAVWFVYGLLRTDIPVLTANLFTLILVVTILGYKIRYK